MADHDHVGTVLFRDIDESFCRVGAGRDERRVGPAFLQECPAALKQRALLVSRWGVQKRL